MTLKTFLMVKTGLKLTIGLLMQIIIGAKTFPTFALSLVINVSASLMTGFVLGVTISALDFALAARGPDLERAMVTYLVMNAALLNVVVVVLVLA